MVMKTKQLDIFDNDIFIAFIPLITIAIIDSSQVSGFNPLLVQ